MPKDKTDTPQLTEPAAATRAPKSPKTATVVSTGEKHTVVSHGKGVLVTRDSSGAEAEWTDRIDGTIRKKGDSIRGPEIKLDQP